MCLKIEILTYFVSCEKKTNSLGTGVSWEKYDAWRIGDTKLDWFGPQIGQGTYKGVLAEGTPMAWTTNNSSAPAYQSINK